MKHAIFATLGNGTTVLWSYGTLSQLTKQADEMNQILGEVRFVVKAIQSEGSK